MGILAVDELLRFGLPKALTTDVPAEALLDACENASEVAAGYVRVRFPWPLRREPPRDLKRAVAMIAAWDLLSAQIGFNPEEPANSVWRERYLDAIRWLTDVASGHVDPGFEAGKPASPEALPGVYSGWGREW